MSSGLILRRYDMTLLDCIDKDLIKIPMTSADKEGVIRELARLYAQKAELDSSKEEEIVNAVLEREAQGSTALGGDIAIPHARIAGIGQSAVIIGISRLAVDFGDAEKKGSRVFFLVLAPADNPSEHVQILSSIAKVCSSGLFLRMLKSSKTRDDVYSLFFE